MTVLLAFSLDHAARVTGLSTRRIRYWDDTDVLHPSVARDEDGGAFARIYSFQDLVGLRTIAQLRDKFGVSLYALRAVADRLRVHTNTPWSELTFYADGRHLYFIDPETKLMLSAIEPGQIALVDTLNLERVALDTERRAQRLLERSGDQIGAVAQNRYVVRNRPVIAGTRIPTLAISEFHEAGYSVEQILREYPRLTAIDVEKAIQYEKDHRPTKRTA